MPENRTIVLSKDEYDDLMLAKYTVGHICAIVRSSEYATDAVSTIKAILGEDLDDGTEYKGEISL